MRLSMRSPFRNNPKTASRHFGQAQEETAARFLIANGLSLIQKNYFCKLGEIDLIMEHANTLVFVEVRYRRSSTHGSASESITPRKIRRLIAAAKHFLLNHPRYKRYPCRFDVVAISPSSQKPCSPPDIHWLCAAFDTSFPFD